MFRPQRFGNDLFAAKPFSEVDQFAAFGTKWTPGRGKPVAGLLAGRAGDMGSGGIHSPIRRLRVVLIHERNVIFQDMFRFVQPGIRGWPVEAGGR